MKKFFILLLFSFFISAANMLAQTDTLITKTRQKIACKITEINELDVKYKKASYMDGPTYTIDKDKLLFIIYANGEKELVKADELSVNKTASEIIDRRKVIKIEPFAPVGNKFVIGYEQVLKVGMNLEAKVGFISSNMSQNILYGGGFGTAFTSGGFFKGGVKFLLGQDYYIKGMKYTHPLKGRYIRIDAILTMFQTRDVEFTYNYATNTNYYGYQTYTTGKTNINTTAYGLMLNYGRQFILGNVMTLDYYIGLGYAGTNLTYSNANVPSNFRAENFNSSYYYSHTSLGSNSAICMNAGLTLGFILK